MKYIRTINIAPQAESITSISLCTPTRQEGFLYFGRNEMRRMINATCPDCNKNRSVYLYNTKREGYSGRCRPCNVKKNLGKYGEEHSQWKGGRHINSTGYMMVSVPGHRLADSRGRVPEHRLVMADIYGASLLVGLHVHHKDGDRLNNDPDNLEIISPSKHSSGHNRTPSTKTRLKDEPNPTIKCQCGCGQTRQKYDKRNRLRRYICWHHRRGAKNG